MNTTPELRNDPVDVGLFLSRLRVFITQPFIILLRHKQLLFIYLLLFIAIATSIKWLVPPTYRATFIIRPTDPKEHFHLRIYGDIAKLIQQKNFERVQQLLKIDAATAASLLSLELYNPSLKQSPDSVNFTEVGLVMKDNKHFNDVQSALLIYLHENPYFKKIRVVQEKQLALTEKSIEKDLRDLDSLKVLQQQSIKRGNLNGNLAVAELMDPVSTYTLAIERVNKQGVIEGQKAFLDNFQLIKSVIAFDKPSFPPSFIVLLLMAFGLAVVVTFLHVFIKHEQ